MFSMSDVCISIVYFNGDESIVNRISNYGDYCDTVLVVDNSDNESSSQLLQKMVFNHKNIYIKRNRKNEGVARALNQALEYAHDEGKKLLLTMDQDSYISAENIRKLIDKIDSDNRIVSVGPSYLKKNPTAHLKEDVTCLITSGNLLLVEPIINVGGYNNELFVDCVDVDISFRLIENGYRLLRVNNAYMEHEIGEYEYSKILHIKYLSHAPQRFYYKYRNNIYIYKTFGKKLPKLCFKLFLSLCVESMRLIFIEKNKKEKVYYAIKGIREAANKKYNTI